jgi:hypothetical protein
MAFYCGSALTSAESTDAGQAFTYRVIEDRQNGTGAHPVLMENPQAHDPSYDELMAFLATDDTVKHQYSKPEYTCADFVQDMQKNAEKLGLNCGYASMKFIGKDSGHAVNVFNTVDEGLVYVDLTSGKTIVTDGLEAGDTYYNLGVISSVSNYW